MPTIRRAEKYVSWNYFVENYKRIYADIKSHKNRVHIVEGDVKPFVLTEQLGIPPNDEHYLTTISKFNPKELRAKQIESFVHRAPAAVDGVVPVDYDEYRDELKKMHRESRA